MSTDISTLAAKSAAHSLKRSRVLYDVNPQAAFLPSVDQTIAALSVARRKRRMQPKVSSQQGSKSTSNALALVSESNVGGPTGSHQASGLKTSTALIRTQDEAASDEPKAGGILVVSPAVSIIQCIKSPSSCV